eukprot:GGOE01010052.1.p3 GENE.GGOE01010052.1~~GGOE01010052.1.p3  ORF type:complete len:110 (+),score=8.74 GGOE01010052.1:328-657(+)
MFLLSSFSDIPMCSVMRQPHRFLKTPCCNFLPPFASTQGDVKRALCRQTHPLGDTCVLQYGLAVHWDNSGHMCEFGVESERCKLATTPHFVLTSFDVIGDALPGAPCSA